MSFPSFANPSPGEFLRDARGNPLPDPGLWVVKHVERLERDNAALRSLAAAMADEMEQHGGDQAFESLARYRAACAKEAKP